MTNKEYAVKQRLKTVKIYKGRMIYELQKIEEVHAAAVSVKNYRDDVRVQTSVKTDKLEESVIRILEVEEHANKKIKDWLDKIKEIEVWIDSINNEAAKNILKLKYITGLKFEEIAEELNYNISHIFRLHNIGLAELSKKL